MSLSEQLKLFQVVCAVNSSRRSQEESGGVGRRLLRLLVSDVTEPAAEEDVRLQERFPESWRVVNMTS